MLQGNVSELEETARLMRYLHESITDHGGTVASLNRLLAGDRGDRELLAKVAKLLVGKIWHHVEHPVPLPIELSDFRLHAKRFKAKYRDINVSGASKYLGFHTPFSETAPESMGPYRLVHFERPMLFHEIIEAIPTSRQAGWRELVAYIALLEDEDFSGCEIIAPGSRTLTRKDEMSPIIEYTGFPVASSSNDVSWRSVKRPDEDKFPTRCFYLVRDF